jgi:calcineurin-like phosphoesterase family protein
MTTWFTADHHFGHKNIIKYCNRPFSDVEEMDKQLIGEWNDVVKDGDVVWHLGDFTLYHMADLESYAGQLNGSMNILPGNHDWRWMQYVPTNRRQEYQLCTMASYSRLATLVSPIVRIPQKDSSIILCHYAMRVWHKSHFNSYQLYGHSHGMLKPVGKQMDVGVDNIYKLYGKYRPISITEVVNHMSSRPNNENFINPTLSSQAMNS